MTIAARLIALLPMQQAGNLGQSPPASAYGAKAGRIIRIGLVLAAVAFAVAFQTGVFTTHSTHQSLTGTALPALPERLDNAWHPGLTTAAHRSSMTDAIVGPGGR